MSLCHYKLGENRNKNFNSVKYVTLSPEKLEKLGQSLGLEKKKKSARHCFFGTKMSLSRSGQKIYFD